MSFTEESVSKKPKPLTKPLPSRLCNRQNPPNLKQRTRLSVFGRKEPAQHQVRLQQDERPQTPSQLSTLTYLRKKPTSSADLQAEEKLCYTAPAQQHPGRSTSQTAAPGQLFPLCTNRATTAPQALPRQGGFLLSSLLLKTDLRFRVCLNN